MKDQETVTISWRAGFEQNTTLVSKLAWLTGKLPGVDFSYLEWRPGAGLLSPKAGKPPILISGPPPGNPDVSADELRLFTKDAGLHAIEDMGMLRWMQWCIGHPSGKDQQDGWQSLEAELIEYPIAMLDNAGASRFGIDHELSGKESMTVREYRIGGELFCWNLLRSEDP
jgi:hypothetical protein